MKSPDLLEGRRQNIDRFRTALSGTPYSGYDVLIVSSSTEDEARYQQELLERAFAGIRTDNAAAGQRVSIVSVVDPTEGGQVIGHVFTWKQALEQAKRQALELDELLKKGDIRVAIYHNGGKGERASPLTQGLGNSRGAQRLVGTVRSAAGEELEQELLLSVVLQTSFLAQTCGGSAVDTYWTSQLLFDTRAPESSPRTGAPLEKFIVQVDRQSVRPKELHDFGTALLRKDGSIVTFYRNRQFGRRNSRGRWEVVEERRADWDDPSYDFGFDFGSFRTRVDLHLALMEFYDSPELWEQVAKTGRDDRKDARDFDPDVVQPLVAILKGIDSAKELPRSLPAAESLRDRVRGLDRKERDRVLSESVPLLSDALPREVHASLEKSKGGREILYFYLLHRDRPFFEVPGRVVGSMRFGAGSYWFTYRRPIDIGNEKFLMLGDMTGRVQEICLDGSLDERGADENDRALAADARRLRGIEDGALARFHVGDREVTVAREDLANGVEVDGVYVNGSVIQGRCRLLPGSRVVDSVLNHVVGRVDAEACYLESVTVTDLVARRSVVHKLVDTKAIRAEGEIVSDAFRKGLDDPGFPPGQVRLRAPVGYDPQSKVDGVSNDEITTTEGGGYTFAEVRAWPSRRRENDALESQLRTAAEEGLES